MAAEPYNEEFIARYLLGDLPEEQQTEIEDRAFRDEGFLQDIIAVESDLIDEYVRQELRDPSASNSRRVFSRRLSGAGSWNSRELCRPLSLKPKSQKKRLNSPSVQHRLPGGIPLRRLSVYLARRRNLQWQPQCC